MVGYSTLECLSPPQYLIISGGAETRHLYTTMRLDLNTLDILERQSSIGLRVETHFYSLLAHIISVKTEILRIYLVLI